MPLPPHLSLTYGQLVWSACYGMEPDQRTRDQLRYLRALGIPEGATGKTGGSGNQLSYGFDDQIELGLGLTALGLGMRPADIGAVLVGHRVEMRRLYRQAWSEIPEAALDAPWVKSRGRMGALIDSEYYIRLHDRYSDAPGTFELLGPEQAEDPMALFAPIERVGGQPPRRVLPLKRLMIQWVAWAREVPVIRTGPKSKG